MNSRFLYIFLFCFVSFLTGCTGLMQSADNLGSEDIVIPSEPRILIYKAEGLVESGVDDSRTPDLINSHEIPLKSFFSFPAHLGLVNALVVSSDGLRAYSGGEDGAVIESEILNKDPKAPGKANDGRKLIQTELLLKSIRPITSLAISTDNKILAVGQSSKVLLFDLEERRIVGELTRIEGRVSELEFDPFTKLLALGLANGEVYAWNLSDGIKAGKDSALSLEHYGSSFSPISRIVFHPLGRAFFVADRRGVVTLWRLLRTEREIGLRDDTAKIDAAREGVQRVRFAQIDGRISDIWLDKEGKILFVAGSDGNIYRWKIRGLLPLLPIPGGKEPINSLTGADLKFDIKSQSSSEVLPILGSASRNQRLVFWCRNGDSKGVVLPNTPVFSGVSEPSLVNPDSLESEFTESLDEYDIDAPKLIPTFPSSELLGDLPDEFLVRSELLAGPLLIVRIGHNSTLLWAAIKTGKLLVFDTKDILSRSSTWYKRLLRCVGN